MGNLWSRPEPLIDFRTNFLSEPTVARFQEIEDRLSWCDKYRLGYSYRTWHTVCLYTFMMNKRTNIDSPELICDFLDVERDVIDGYQNHEEWAIYPMLILWKVTGKSKYEKIINNINDPDFKTLTLDIIV